MNDPTSIETTLESLRTLRQQIEAGGDLATVIPTMRQLIDHACGTVHLPVFQRELKAMHEVCYVGEQMLAMRKSRELRDPPAPEAPDQTTSCLRFDQNKVYFPDGRMFRLPTYGIRVLSTEWFNGEPYLIIKVGENIWLDRFRVTPEQLKQLGDYLPEFDKVREQMRKEQADAHEKEQKEWFERTQRQTRDLYHSSDSDVTAKPVVWPVLRFGLAMFGAYHLFSLAFKYLG